MPIISIRYLNDLHWCVVYVPRFAWTICASSGSPRNGHSPCKRRSRYVASPFSPSEVLMWSPDCVDLHAVRVQVNTAL